MDLNRWNQIRYGFYAPVYDVAGRIFTRSRRIAMDNLGLLPGQKVLLIGAGTGLDLEWIPPGVDIVAIDLAKPMLNKLRRRMRLLGLSGTVLQMDGLCTTFADNSFDAVILHLVVTVVPDPVQLLREARRILKPQGKISVFDVLVPRNKKITWGRRLAHIPVNFFFSVMTCQFERLETPVDLVLLEDTPAEFWGQYRRILLQKKEMQDPAQLLS
ncbi:MAG: class I SAM-dependent methyltransferase [Lewinellaceae bacterium]|nr:class I SAM-dependent methyltransferase [Lewinellaceae bacterium]HPR00318.1 class I SAM-dependent methyltransferase [Saprospiraceae bacterium]